MEVWSFGFVADFIGAVFLVGKTMFDIGFSNEVLGAIHYNPFEHPLAFIVVFAAIVISAASIFLLNYHYIFKNTIVDKKQRFKVSLTIAILTIPWTFLIPMDWSFR